MAKSPHLSKHLAAIMELCCLINENTWAECILHYYPAHLGGGLHLSVYPNGYEKGLDADFTFPWDILTEEVLCDFRRKLVDLYQEQTGDKLWNLLP